MEFIKTELSMNKVREDQSSLISKETRFFMTNIKKEMDTSRTNSPVTPSTSNPGTPRSDEVRATPPPSTRLTPQQQLAQQIQQQQQQLQQQHLQQFQNQQSLSKYSQLLAVIEDMGRDIRPTYASSKTSAERLKRGIVHARILVRECLMECERSARS